MATQEEITRNYQSLFGRAPDDGGLTYWLNSGLEGDALVLAMEEGATGDDEAYLENGGPVDNTAEIQQDYQDLFGREASPDGLQYWQESGLTGNELLSALRDGATGDDADLVQASRDEVNNLYRQLFGRDGDAEGIDYWLNSGLQGNDLIAGMLEGATGDDIPGGGVDGFQMDEYTKAMQQWINNEGIFGESDGSGTSGGLLTDGPGEFTESPGYQFRLAEGQKAIERGAAAKGNLLGGATQKALTKFGQDYATNDYDNFLSRYYDSLNPWLSLAGAGQVSANASANTAASYGSDAANTLSQTGNSIGNYTMNANNLTNQNTLSAGDAQASGYINSANALSSIGPNAINAYSAWKYFNG